MIFISLLAVFTGDFYNQLAFLNIPNFSFSCPYRIFHA